MELTTKIWWRDKYVIINPENPPKDERQLVSFLRYNNAAPCFFKASNAWHKVTKEGDFIFVSKTLYLLPFKEWLKIANDDYHFNSKQ